MGNAHLTKFTQHFSLDALLLDDEAVFDFLTRELPSFSALSDGDNDALVLALLLVLTLGYIIIFGTKRQ